jgi:hypothetical protein
MLKFLHLGAALAAILSTQVPSNLLATQENFAEQGGQARASKVLMSDSIPNARMALTNASPSLFTADSSTNTPEAAETVGFVGTVLGIAAVGGGVVGVVLSAKKVRNHLKSSPSLSPRGQGNTIRIERASHELQKKLLKLLHNDQETASRLLSNVKWRNPNRSINWCVEKVIYDLQRDRGSY